MSRHEEIVRNLNRLISERGTNPSALARSAGLNHTAARDIMTGKTQNPTDRVLSRLASALNVEVADLTGDSHGRTNPQMRFRGMSDNDAAPYVPDGKSGGANAGINVAQVIAPNATTPATYIVSRALPSFALLRGDVLVLDLARHAQVGDLVVATVADQVTGEAQTIVRRFLTPYLVSGDPDSPTPALLADGTRTVVLAPVEAMYRPTRRN